MTDSVKDMSVEDVVNKIDGTKLYSPAKGEIIRRFAAILRVAEYRQHKEGCEFGKPGCCETHDKLTGCTCGLSAALLEAGIGR